MQAAAGWTPCCVLALTPDRPGIRTSATCGQAAARNRLPGFRGIVISGWTCTDSARPGFDGIFAPPETPILALAWDHDAFREGTPQQGSCANKFGERKSARQLFFPGTEHGTYSQRGAREALAQFLRENLAP